MISNSEIVHTPERRLKPRIECNYLARIQGEDGNGMKFEEDGRSINLSRNGMYVLLNREIPIGVELSIRLAVPTGLLDMKTSNLAVHGTVVRGDLHSGVKYGIAIKFQKYRFI